MRRWILLLAVATIACGQTPTEFRPLPASLGDIRGVALGFERLKQLGEEEGIYAAWINLDRGEVVGLGGFQVNAAGQPLDESGAVIERFSTDQAVFGAVSVFVTQEAAGVPTRPGSNVVLQGPFFDGVAELNVPAPAESTDATGRYRVFTPTDGPGTNEGSGLWAIDVDDEPLLELPATNNVYTFEHFMIIDGRALTMGRFNANDEVDTVNRFSGEEPAPEVPGEDFLVNAPEGLIFPADLSGARLIVTLEARIGDLVDPSQLVILEAILPAGLQGGEIIALMNVTGDFPTGTAVVF